MAYDKRLSLQERRAIKTARRGVKLSKDSQFEESKYDAQKVLVSTKKGHQKPYNQFYK